MKMRLLHAALTLTLWGGCAREPVVSLELRAVPTEAATLEVWTWVDQVGVKSPTLFPIAAPQETLRLGLRLGQAASIDPTLTRLLGHPGRTLAEYIADHADLFAAERP